MSKRVLVVEDEEHILEGLVLNLELEGYDVTTATDGEEAVDRFKQERFDVIVLDVMLPKMDGFAVCETIRLENRQVPILFLTAKDGGQDRVQGLKIGADDYLTKPFNLEEFLLRVNKLVERTTSRSEPEQRSVYSFGPNEVNFSSYQIKTHDGQSKQITAREAKLLQLLINHKDEVVSREQILEKVWGYDVFPSTRTIDNFILNFRKYFEENPRKPKYFHSVRGVGYRFTNDG
jgi:two-component system alkaline phosphatase synthesis response regulator PhoP